MMDGTADLTCQVDVPVCRCALAVSEELAKEVEDTVSDAVRAPGAPEPLVHHRALAQPPVSPDRHVVRPPRLTDQTTYIVGTLL